MDGSNSRWPVAENGHYDDLLHDGGGGPTIRVNAVHGLSQLCLVVPSQFTFGELKKCIAQEIGLEPNQQRLLFRGMEKDDQEYLHMVGVKDNAKVLLMEEQKTIERNSEEVEGNEFSSAAEVRPEKELGSMEGTVKDRELKEAVARSCAAVAQVRAEVDKLSEQVAALEGVVYGGTQVGEKEFIILSELLMRQLLTLDGIEAEGEGKVQRKLEVHRVQSFVDTVDSLKERNSNPLSNNSRNVSVTTEWETFGSEMESFSAPPPFPSSTAVSQDWERFN
ncbi:BAG family molecular chaperone regulator 4-like isoform X1 [Rhododendron vialii]|uniref:BAG family molecular chaperone regulator 4-like isoform X1 n=2 Tax=Rhododendron vialii TaxID=182163 RepID=UPI00265EAF70|nr:BAG family molecular chaperone regulator 4-like isoform X1 [Rhododendron vialii]